MKNKIIILGSGTCNNEKEKANSSILIQINGMNIIYDFGYRVFHRLKELNLTQDDICHIIISHFHPDHFCDLIPYIHSGLYSLEDKRNKKLNIYSNKNIFQFMNVIKKLLLTPSEFEKIINLFPVEDSSEIQIEGLKINCRILNHFDNVAIKFFINDKIISITGDLDFEKDDLKFFGNSDYCFFYSGKLKEKEIIYFKKHHLIKSLIILHSYLDLNKTQLLKENIILGKDFMKILI